MEKTIVFAVYFIKLRELYWSLALMLVCEIFLGMSMASANTHTRAVTKQYRKVKMVISVNGHTDTRTLGHCSNLNLQVTTAYAEAKHSM